MSRFIRVSAAVYEEILGAVPEELRRRVEADAQTLVTGLAYHEGDLRAAVEAVFAKRYGPEATEREEVGRVVAHFLEQGLVISEAAEVIAINIELHLDETESPELEALRVGRAGDGRKNSGGK